MNIDLLTLECLLEGERKHEQHAEAEVRMTMPNTTGHVKWHGIWQRHRGRRQLLETLIKDARRQAYERVAV